MKGVWARVLTAALALTLAAPLPVQADPLTFVSDEISKASGGATNVTHTVKFTTLLDMSANASNEIRIDLSAGPFTGASCLSITVSPALLGQTCSVAANVITLPFIDALPAATALTVTIPGTTNPSPGGNTAYLIPISTRQSGSTVDSATAAVFIWASGIQSTFTITAGLAISASPSSFAFDLDPTGTTSDASKSTALTITTNGKNGFSVTLLGSRQLTNEAYTAVVPNTFGGTTTSAAAWGSGGVGFGYSLDGGSTYYTLDTSVPRTVFTGSGPTGASGSSRTINYKAAVDWTVPAGIYSTQLYFLVAPEY